MQPLREFEASVRPLRRSEYERLVEQGCFEGEPIELLWGSLVRMSPQRSKHAATVQKLTRALVLAAAKDDRASIRVQSPFAATDDSEPEPDLAAVPFGDYEDAHPRRALLIVEVAETSVRADRAKAAIYAAAQVPEYWIVNLVDRVVEVHDAPDGATGRYGSVRVLGPDETLDAKALPGLELAVADLV